MTPPGFLTAHERFCLVLLCSQPDTVHRVPLRETQTSSPLIKGSPTTINPGQSITPTIADCWYRAPLTPQLLGDLSISCFAEKVNRRKKIMEEPLRKMSGKFYKSLRHLRFCSLSFLKKSLSICEHSFSNMPHSSST